MQRELGSGNSNARLGSQPFTFCLTFFNLVPNVTSLKGKCNHVLPHIKSCQQDLPPALILYYSHPLLPHWTPKSFLIFLSLPYLWTHCFSAKNIFLFWQVYFQPKLQDLLSPYSGKPSPWHTDLKLGYVTICYGYQLNFFTLYYDLTLLGY